MRAAVGSAAAHIVYERSSDFDRGAIGRQPLDKETLASMARLNELPSARDRCLGPCTAGSRRSVGICDY